MKKKTLIINYSLALGGAEKLLMELVEFCTKNNIQPDVLILDSKDTGYYDSSLKQKGLNVYRVPVFQKYYGNIFLFIYWRFKLYFSDFYYDSIHIINLFIVDKIYDDVRHKKRYFWHIVNKMQYPNNEYPYRQKLVSNSGDCIVTINKYEMPELKEYFKNIRCRIIEFKLFLHRN